MFREFRKNAVVLRAGQVEDHISFVCKGTAGLFLEEETDEICHAFVFEGSYLCSYESFVNQSPSLLTARALDELVLASISHKDMQQVLATPEGLAYAKTIADQLFFGSQRRIFSLITETAEQRFHSLMQSRPEVFRLMKRKHIASYLGMTPVSLSRIMSKTHGKS